MNKELILKLIERARESADNAYCPFTNTPIGCSLLVDDNIIFGGCNIECSSLSCSSDAGEVAVYKAVSEGYTSFRALCFWSGKTMPYPSGKTRQLLAEFNKKLSIVVATDETYAVVSLDNLFPFPPEVQIDE